MQIIIDRLPTSLISLLNISTQFHLAGRRRSGGLWMMVSLRSIPVKRRKHRNIHCLSFINTILGLAQQSALLPCPIPNERTTFTFIGYDVGNRPKFSLSMALESMFVFRIISNEKSISMCSAVNVPSSRGSRETVSSVDAHSIVQPPPLMDGD